ncbi:MAG: glutathione S-transferase family protein [Pseudomonadales bacterium]|nr:glutathione S-transferase family protein [Pseudomonadales bacterium]
MLKLYHCHNSRSLRPLWCLEEMGLDYELITMPFPPRFEYDGYLDINPLGTVPTFIDGDLVMTESSGICHYLVEKYGPTPLGMTVEEAEYGDFLNWLYRSDATFTFPQAIVLRYSRLEPAERQLPQAVEDYTIWFHSRLRSVETALENKDYLVGDRFTVADISVTYALTMAQRLGIDDRFKPNTKRYLESMTARDGFKRAIQRGEAG